MSNSNLILSPTFPLILRKRDKLLSSGLLTDTRDQRLQQTYKSCHPPLLVAILITEKLEEKRRMRAMSECAKEKTEIKGHRIFSFQGILRKKANEKQRIERC